MKRLKFVFLTSEGKRHHFYPKLKTDKLTNSDIKSVVEQFLEIQSQYPIPGVNLFDKIEKVVWEEKNTKHLFKTKGKAIYIPSDENA